MYGELRNFSSGYDMADTLAAAAHGPANTVGFDSFMHDISNASEFFDKESYYARRPFDTADMSDGFRPVVSEAMDYDMHTASEFFDRDAYYQRKTTFDPMANASGAGYEASKSAYIENNKGGYQARPRPSELDIEIPLRRDPFEHVLENSSIRMSNYRRNHLKTVTRGLRALT